MLFRFIHFALSLQHSECCVGRESNLLGRQLHSPLYHHSPLYQLCTRVCSTHVLKKKHLWSLHQSSFFFPVGPKVASDCSASDSKHPLTIHQCWQGTCDLFARPILDFTVLGHIQANGLRTANQSIHKRLEKALFRSGDQHWEGGLWLLPKSSNLSKLEFM